MDGDSLRATRVAPVTHPPKARVFPLNPTKEGLLSGGKCRFDAKSTAHRWGLSIDVCFWYPNFGLDGGQTARVSASFSRRGCGLI